MWQVSPIRGSCARAAKPPPAIGQLAAPPKATLVDQITNWLYCGENLPALMRRLVLGFRVIAQTNRDGWVLTESATAHISLVGAP